MTSFVINSKAKSPIYYKVGNGVGTFTTINGATVGILRLPTDPIGLLNLTLTNIVVGSNLQVETATGTPVLNITCDTSTEILNLQVYAPGSPNNDLIIKVRKGTAAPYYRPWETVLTATVGSQSIYVSQIPD